MLLINIEYKYVCINESKDIFYRLTIKEPLIMNFFLIFIGSLILLTNLILLLRVVFTYAEKSFEVYKETQTNEIEVTALDKA